MSYQRTLLRRALIVGLSIVSAGAICHRALGIGPGWPAGPVPTPLPTPPAGPSPSPAPSATPTPTASPVAIPKSYVQIITMESPTLQYRDGSGSDLPVPPPHPENGPYTCVVAMYLDSTDPVQFVLVRTFQTRSPGDVYGSSQLVSSPGVSAQYTAPLKLANILTTLTVYAHPENPYGKETLSFYSADSHGNPLTLEGSVPIMVYPKSTAKIFNAFVTNPSPTPLASPSPTPSPYPYPSASPYPIPYPSPIPGGSPPNPLVDFIGDTARLNIEIYNAYPGGTTWVICYPTPIPPALPTSIQEVPNSRSLQPPADLLPKRNVFIEVGTAKNSSGALLFPSSAKPIGYTVQVVQYRPPYHDPPYPPNSPPFQESLATASFTVVSSSFNINSQIGKLTP